MKKIIFSLLATIIFSVAVFAQSENNSIKVTYLGYDNGHKFLVKNKEPYAIKINYFYTLRSGYTYSTSNIPIKAGATFVIWAAGAQTDRVYLKVNVRDKVTATTDTSPVVCSSN